MTIFFGFSIILPLGKLFRAKLHRYNLQIFQKSIFFVTELLYTKIVLILL